MIRLSLLLIAAAPALAQSPPPTPVPWGKANAANLAAMVRPQDLAQPVPASPASGRLEAAAVTRLLNDKAKDLVRENARQGGGGEPQ